MTSKTHPSVTGRARRYGAGLALLLGLQAPVGAGALDVPIPGSLGLTRRDVTTGDGKLVKLSSRKEADEGSFPLPAAGGPDDPRAAGGTFLRAQCSGGIGAGCVVEGAWAPVSLAAAGWRALGDPPGSKGYRYRGAPGEPCRLVLLKERAIRVVCKGPDAVDPLFSQPVAVLVTDDLRVGGLRFCTQWLTSYRRNVPFLWRDEDQAAPPACPSFGGTPTPTPTPTPPYGSASRAFTRRSSTLLE